MMNRLLLTPVLATLFLGLLVSTHAQWPDRHGPTQNGHAAAADAKDLPTVWTADKGIAWKAELHDEGHSSPIVMNGKVWLTTASKDGKKQWIMAFDEETGEKVHDVMLFENREPESLGGAKGFNNYAAPSCVAEDGAVYVHFGSYGTTRLDSKTAEVVWARRDLPCRHYRGPGSSPTLFEDMLVLTFDGIDQQYTTALNKETGKTIWRTDRTTDYGDIGPDGKPHREGDLRKAYCTPGIARVGDQVQLLSVGSKAMQSYDIRTGKELWTVRHKNYNAGIRPIWLEQEGFAVINTGSRQAHVMAVKLDKTTTGDVTDSHIAWDRDKGNPRFSMPLYHDGLIYLITDTGVAACIDAKNGKELWKERVKGNYRSSPMIANGHIYFFSEEGRGTVIKLGRAFEEVQINEVEAMGTTACPAVSKGAIFIRGKTHLFKIAGS